MDWGHTIGVADISRAAAFAREDTAIGVEGALQLLGAWRNFDENEAVPSKRENNEQVAVKFAGQANAEHDVSSCRQYENRRDCGDSSAKIPYLQR
jgi:hypothetical protein